MNLYVAICLLAVTASAKADGALGLGGVGGLVYAPGHASADYYAYPRYAFEYAVKDPHTGDNKAQWEKRDGDVVKGAYSLVEPDGSLRVVEYWADDKSGFNAVVKRLGPNLHPTTVHAAPIYKAPIPVLSHGPIVSPISIGPVANLGHLSSAPLISGPIHGPAVSSQSLIREPVPIVKSVLPGPIPHEPILQAPIYKAPLLSGPIYKSGPIYSEPLGPLPIYKAPLPIYKEPIPVPVYKEHLPVPLYKEALPLPLWKGPLEHGPIGGYELGKGPIGYDGLGKGLLGLGGYSFNKGPYGPNYDLIEKAPLLPAWNGPLEYPLYPGDYKH